MNAQIPTTSYDKKLVTLIWTRAEAIEETKSIIDEEIDRLRDLREYEQDANRWLELDENIDALLIMKDNAAAMLDAQSDPYISEVLLAARDSGSPDEDDLGTHVIISGGEVLELGQFSPDEHGHYDSDYSSWEEDKY